MPSDFRYRLLKILYEADGEIINLRPIFQPEFEAETLKRITLSEALRNLHAKKFIWYEDVGSLTVRFAGNYNDEVPINAKIKDEGIEEFLRLQNIYEPDVSRTDKTTMIINAPVTSSQFIQGSGESKVFATNSPATNDTRQSKPHTRAISKLLVKIAIGIFIAVVAGLIIWWITKK